MTLSAGPDVKLELELLLNYSGDNWNVTHRYENSQSRALISLTRVTVRYPDFVTDCLSSA